MNDREAQAQAEIGHTEVRRSTASWLAAAFLTGLVAVPLWQLGADLRPGAQDEGVPGPWAEMRAALPGVAGALAEVGPGAANQALLRAMVELERSLERQSRFAATLLPPTQWIMSRFLGVGNQQAYLGRQGWLFYRPTVDYVTGPGFLDPVQLEKRHRGPLDPHAAEIDAEPAQPDPLPALLELGQGLADRGVGLLVMPTPGKATIHPELLAATAGGQDEPLQNPSFRELGVRLRAAGVDVFDPAPLLLEAARAFGADQFLKTDTHWRPQALDRVAQRLADRVGELLEIPEVEVSIYRRRALAVENLGDITRMLRLPPWQQLYPPERVEIDQVSTTRGGRLWRADPTAEILLLGDSFTNVYSQQGLGWGRSAGLAEQLSFYLQRPVDRIALNAGGAFAARQSLHRQLAGGKDRLAGKKLVIYQFATRELSGGDWKRFARQGAESTHSGAAPAEAATRAQGGLELRQRGRLAR